MPHLFKSTHRPGYTMRPRAKRANKPRAQSVWYPLHDHRPARLAQLVQHRFKRHGHYLYCSRRGLCHRLRRRSLLYPLRRPLHRPRSAGGTTSPSGCSHVALSPKPAFAANRDLRSSLTLGALVQDYAPSTSCKSLLPLAASPALSAVPVSFRFALRLRQRSPEENLYLRRSTIMRSVRLLCRVFLPNVGKAHGVCG